MPMFIVYSAGEMPTEMVQEMQAEISKTIARVKGCPIEAVSGVISEQPLSHMSQGGEDWKTIVEKGSDAG